VHGCVFDFSPSLCRNSETKHETSAADEVYKPAPHGSESIDSIHMAIPVQGAAFVLLNLLRGISVVSLVLVMVTSLIIVVKNFLLFGFFFFLVLNHIFLFLEASLLIAAESEMVSGIFAANLPLLGPDRSSAVLGLLQLIMASNVLSDLVTYPKTVPLSAQIAKLLLATAIIVGISGGLNFFIAALYGSNAKAVRRDGATCTSMLDAEARRPPLDVSPPNYKK